MTIGAEQCNFDVFLMMIVCLIRPVLVSAQMEYGDVGGPRHRGAAAGLAKRRSHGRSEFFLLDGSEASV